ncbi:MAG: DMT family transporter [Proteobacteria bacterium]|nr:DMT family transporter [Pseudomonadota bacterium]
MLALVTIIWGLNWPSAKFGLQDFSPWTFRTICFGSGAAILMAVARYRGISLHINGSTARWHLVVAGLLSIGGFGVLAAFAQLATTTSRTAICAYTMPIWATLFARVFLGERLDGRRGTALLIGAAGLLVLFWPLFEDGLPIGAIYALGSAVSWAAGTVYLKWARVPAHPIAVTSWQLVVGTISVALGFCLSGFAVGDVRHWSSLAGLTYSTLAGTALAYLFWFQSVARLPASTAGLGTLLVPVIGVLAAMVLLGDRPTLTDAIGFIMISIAALCALGATPAAKSTPVSA